MKKLIILVLVLGLVGVASAGTLVVPATDDAQVDEANPDHAYGLGGYMYISGLSGYDRDGYFMFDTSAIPAGQTITSASLTTKIHVNSTTGDTADFYSVANDSWDESTITYNNAPAAGSTALFSIYVNGTGVEGGVAGSPQVDSTDVTSYVASSYAGSDSLISFAATGGIGGLFIRSKEDSLGRDIPSVELTVNYVPEPMTIALLGLGGLFLRKRK